MIDSLFYVVNYHKIEKLPRHPQDDYWLLNCLLIVQSCMNTQALNLEQRTLNS